MEIVSEYLLSQSLSEYKDFDHFNLALTRQCQTPTNPIKPIFTFLLPTTTKNTPEHSLKVKRH